MQCTKWEDLNCVQEIQRKKNQWRWTVMRNGENHKKSYWKKGRARQSGSVQVKQGTQGFRLKGYAVCLQLTMKEEVRRGGLQEWEEQL